jgi:uncharacterized membrane protein
MRTETTTRNIYTFEELSDKAKEKARDWWREGALDIDWWESTYEDAENIGLKITGFDIGRGNDITGDFTDSPEDVAKKIMEEHGEHCETYIDARHFLKELEEFMDKAKKDEWGELATLKLEDEREAIENEFQYAILQDYLAMLKREIEWLMADEQVDEAITCIEYEFTEEGELA